jgi:hypothetical protein
MCGIFILSGTGKSTSDVKDSIMARKFQRSGFDFSHMKK